MKAFLRRLSDIIAPRTCCICGQRLSIDEQLICNLCLIHLPLTDFIEHPYDNEMAKAFWGQVKNMEKAYAFIYHQPHSASSYPLYQLKYFRKSDIGINLGFYIGKLLVANGFLNDIDALVPVPLAPKRIKERGYNQSELIALGLHEASHLPILNKVVRRTSFESSQTNKDRWDRAKNVDKTFEVVDDKKIDHKHLLIIDDIVTTGATICALAKEMEKHADVRISVASVGFAQSSLTSVTSSNSFK